MTGSYQKRRHRCVTGTPQNARIPAITEGAIVQQLAGTVGHMALLSLSLLGGFRARLFLGADVEIPRKKARALLAYLASYPGHNFLRDKLASLLWGDLSDEQARHNLRQTLLTLRAALPVGPPILLSDGEAIGLAPDTVEVDVVTYERLAAETAPEALTEAANLYQGDFLDGFVVEEAPFEEW